MSKDAMDRLAETVMFIKTKQADSGLNAEQFREVTQDLDDWMAVASPAKKIKLSGLMHAPEGRHVKFDKDGRKFVRAGVLIDCALVYAEDKWTEQARMQIGLGEAKNDQTQRWSAIPKAPFEAACLRARDAVYSTPSQVGLMLAGLRSEPLDLLRKYKFIVNGGNKAGNPVTYGVSMTNGAWNFNCYDLRGYNIKAVNVMATNYKDIKDTPGAIAPVDSSVHEAADLLLTTQFTGCSFCFMKSTNGQNMLAAHIDPGKSKTFGGTDLSKVMREQGGFTQDNGGALKVYGRVPNNSEIFGYPESAGQMIIVGVRKGTDWRLYSQITKLDDSLVAQRIDA